MTPLTDILSRMSPISLSEMEAVKLMNRLDTKYVTSMAHVRQVLLLAANQYFVQEIGGERIAAYDTLYYDTSALAMYIEHHNRRLVRQKVRIRRYIGSPSNLSESGDLTFLEIKNKNNRGRTKKKRIEVINQAVLTSPSDEVSAFMQKRCRYSCEQLLPQLRTVFRRITLVSKQKNERLTVDFALHWSNIHTGREVQLEPLVIIELKRDGLTYSPMADILRQLRIKPMKISKYCIGTALTNPDVKQNRFKQKIRKIQRILTDENT